MTKQEIAKQIVDRCAANPLNKSNEDLARNIYEELQSQAPKDEELLGYVIQYMMLLATQSCGEGADHACDLNHPHEHTEENSLN